MSIRTTLLFTITLAAALLLVLFINRAPTLMPPLGAKAPPVISPPVAIASAASSNEPRHYCPRQVTADVRLKVDDFIRRYKDMSPEELAKQEEFSAMTERFIQQMETPEFQLKIEERIQAIKAAKGLQHGTLTLGAEKLDSPEFRAWLEAIFSDDPQRMENFIMNKLDGAIFDFAFDPKMEKTSDGVSVKSSTNPSPAADNLPD
jgi:hypothetical protein